MPSLWMEMRYRALARLLDGVGAGGLLVDTDEGVAIMLVSKRG